MKPELVFWIVGWVIFATIVTALLGVFGAPAWVIVLVLLFA